MLTRQEFLRGSGALGLGTFLAGLPGLTHPSLAQAGDAPRRGGVLSVNLSGDPATFDPISGTSSLTMLVIGPCYNGLVKYNPQDPDGIVPDLASSWSTSSDGKTITFQLLRNVKFHDGKPMTSADVKFTFDYIRNPPAGVVSARKAVLSTVESIDAPDDYTVSFKLTRPSPSFLANMASCWMLVLPKHVLEKGQMKEIVGTGPFKFKEYKRGVSIEIERNADYHVPNRPYLDGLKAFIVPDSGTTWGYLQSGRLQWFTSIQGQDAGAYKSSGDVTVESGPSTSYIGAIYNLKAKPFDNVLVRKAASLAIDRQAALAITGNGQGQYGGITVPGAWALPATELNKIEGYSADPRANIAAAKKLLADAGHPNGFPVKVLVRKNPLFEPVGVFLKDQWAKIGINATLDIQENAAFATNFAKGDYQACASGGSYAISDPDTVFGDYFTCAGGLNSYGLCSTEIDQLFEKQSETLDPAERKRLVNELEKRVLAEYGVYVIYWRDRFMGLSKKIRGLKVHPNIDNNMRLEDVWLTS